MNPYFPIYTEQAECQDCYKCVRACSNKAIQVENGSASVIQELCVLCGKCVQVCPVGAKRVRDDVGRVKRLISMKDKVILSLAPSFINEFSDVSKDKLIHGLKKLGFYGVSETALGAQEVSAHVADIIENSEPRLMFSSACPTVVQLVKKYYPEFADNVTELHSPLLAHATLLKENYGNDIAVVFAGPCISKKFESDTFNELLDVAISFENLKTWFEKEEIILADLEPTPEDHFIPNDAKEGSLYPVDGGMLAGIKANCAQADACFMAFSGLDNLRDALTDLKSMKLEKSVFVEMLACEGGCVNGPQITDNKSIITKRYNVLQNAEYSVSDIPKRPQLNIYNPQNISGKAQEKYDEFLIRDALLTVGKVKEKDELNCGGCGYDTCRDFAIAMLDGKAEQGMCVSYMRKLAHKKANALLSSMPSGVVIVDKDLRIVECNQNFARLLGKDVEDIYDAKPGLEGASLEKIIPFTHYFKNVLDDGIEKLNLDIKHENSIFNLTLFSIEPNRIIGGIFQDVTEPAIQKEQIINRARQVIENNLSTVQKIAYLLGENASETEVILDSIIGSYSNTTIRRDENG